jgi:histidinol phosphatase-like enzyme (inositol monophosphatase family)
LIDEKQALGFAQHLADTARTVALRYFRTSPHIICKADKSPVTVADCEIESLLRQLIHERYPRHGIIGEEYGRAPGVSPAESYNWILDPIDGTKSFIMGNPLFGTLIGLLRGDEPVIGLIDLPAMGERWIGAGKSTTFNDGMNDCAAVASKCHSIEQTRLYIAPAPGQADEHYGIAALSRLAALTNPVCDCYAYGLLASGHCDLVVESGLEPFDYLPLVPVINGAGGWMTDWSGNPLSLNSDGRVIAAATKPLLETAINVLKNVKP